MTWAEFKLLLKNKLQFDPISSEDLNNTAIASAFDLRAKLLLQSFVRDTYYLWGDRIALTLATNDQEVNLMDAAKCAKAIYWPMIVWVNGSKKEMYSFPDQETQYGSSATVSSGEPSTWASPQEGYIRFEKKCASGYSNSSVSGYRKHADISSDSDTLELMEWDAMICVLYCAANFALPVVSSDVGLMRLEKYNAESAAAMKALAAERKRRRHGGGVGLG